MDAATINILGEMGANLSILAFKGTATVVHSRIQLLKKEKNMEQLRNTYDEIINQLLTEREEAIRIAQAYKEELEKVEISDEDILHLHNTVTMVLAILLQINPDSLEHIEAFESIKDLISVDVLKTMQLIGFNYKAAIGEPLTVLIADLIGALGKKKSTKRK